MSFESFPSTPEVMKFTVPEIEINIDYARSSGAGGQNVNKRDTKAQITWSIRNSLAFTDDQKAILKRELANWINSDGLVSIQNQETRSREQNRSNAIDRLNEIVTMALTPEKERKPTKPTRSSKERRLDEKAQHSKLKRERGSKDWE